ncbi:MAG: AAA family ATPase [Muribaculaceae bacterium]|nr:AAA family ATPase [Muribaculaceae bacterium]
MAIPLSVEQLYETLETTPVNHNILLVGNHGIGKSRIMEEYFTSKGMKVTALFLGQMSDPGDLIGLPRLNEETGKTDFMPPYWFPTDGVPIVLFLDELNRARPEMLQTVMDLVLNRKLAGRKLPEGSRIISAVNSGEQYQVGELDPALVSRFNVYELRPTAQDWIKWAKRENLDDRVISFITNHPDMLDSSFDASEDSLSKSPDRRAWERTAQLLSNVKNPNPVHARMVAGIIGAKAASLLFDSFSNKGITGKDVVDKYPDLVSQIQELPMEKFALLNDDILEYLENSVANKKKITSKNMDNVADYLGFLRDKKRDAYAYFINGLMSGKYKKTMGAFSKSKPELIIEFSQFISEI